MRRITLAMFLILCVLLVPACKPAEVFTNPKTVSVYHLKDGRYCYHDQTDLKWYWLVSDSGTSESPIYYKETADKPSGYHWETLAPHFTPVFPPSFTEIVDLDAKHEAVNKTVATDSRGLLRTQ